MITAEEFLTRHAPRIEASGVRDAAVGVPDDGVPDGGIPDGGVPGADVPDRMASLIAAGAVPGVVAAVSADGGAGVAGGGDADGGSSHAIDDVEECREAALRLLDAAPRPSGALRRRLLDKGYADGVVDEVIERLTRVRLLDDQAYAESAIRYCAGRLMGRRGAVMELTRKGVSRDLAERVAAEAEARGEFEEAVWELGRRYAGRTRGLDPAVRRRRFWSAGGRKGHSPDALRRVAEELFRD